MRKSHSLWFVAGLLVSTTFGVELLRAKSQLVLGDATLASIHGETQGFHTVTDNCANYATSPFTGYSTTDCSTESTGTSCYTCNASLSGQVSGGTSTSMSNGATLACGAATMQKGACGGSSNPNCINLVDAGACTPANGNPTTYTQQPQAGP